VQVVDAAPGERGEAAFQSSSFHSIPGAAAARRASQCNA
jgi:hypothetical protein